MIEAGAVSLNRDKNSSIMQINTKQDIFKDGSSLPFDKSNWPVERSSTVDARIVARMTGLHYQTILRHIRNGNLPATRSASYMIRPEHVKEFINNLTELSRVGPRRAKARTTVKA